MENGQQECGEGEARGSSHDMINHPAHYGGADNPFEAIKIIEAWGLGFHLASAVKYIVRAGRKSLDPREDIEKAIWYVERAAQDRCPLYVRLPQPRAASAAEVAGHYGLSVSLAAALTGILKVCPTARDMPPVAAALRASLGCDLPQVHARSA